ncbi:MAG: protease modulator HflC [Opitutae bacterium]|jgi:membrane protease subunit HflC|nr:protease modulator HflC [Opitutae bacterium]MBT5915911.1 protease modulator HflC [Opitutae bacterium]MBT7405111.1 protease modulator HflC [Opitutae bacterium]
MKLQLALIPIILVLWAVYVCSYVVEETDQVIITQFGKPVGDPQTKAGLHFKLPFIQDINRIEKRFLPWDGPSNEMSTKDKTYLIIDTFARWRIDDPMQYFLRLRDERSALSRLDDILGSEIRNAVARHELIEIVRTNKDRKAKTDESLVQGIGKVGTLNKISIGREVVEQQILEKAATKLKGFGIELLDVRFKRINYNETVRRRIYERMVSERNQIADRFRSEGAGEAAKIMGKKEKDLAEIESESYKSVQKIYGEADANASAIYASSYNKSPEAVEFYSFIKTLETYKEVLNSDISLFITTKNPLFKLFKTLDSGN